MEEQQRKGIGLAMKWFGSWLVFTAALLLFGETAPSVLDPNLFPITACALGGLACYLGGCRCERRRG